MCFGYVGPMSPLPVLLLFIAIPLVEIYFLIKVGDVIGAFTTVVLVVATAVLGASIARYQGLVTLQRVQATVARGEAPAIEMLEGVILFLGAVLLLIPGFVTDIIGFACLVPPLRRAIALWALQHMIVPPPPPRGGPGSQSGGHETRTLEGEFRREDD
jgi:UPF0716 protein FxsA